MAGGRPTDFNSETTQKTWEYIESGWKKQNERCPTAVGLATWLDVDKVTLYDWASQSEKKEFSHAFKRVKDVQERMLASGGLGGQFNPAITKLMLATNHGYFDKQATDVTSGGEKILGINIVQPKDV